MKLYLVTFRKTENKYHGPNTGKCVMRKLANGKEEIKNIPEEGLIVPEIDMLKYQGWGDGYKDMKFLGEIDDEYFMQGEKEFAKKTIENSVRQLLGEQEVD